MILSIRNPLKKKQYHKLFKWISFILYFTFPINYYIPSFTEYPKKMLQYCRKYDFQGFRSLVFLQYHMILSDPAEIQVSPSLPSSHFLLLPPPIEIENLLRISLGIRRTFCRALHCCTRSTCTRFCALGSAMGYSPVPVPVGWSIRSSMCPPSRGPPLRAIYVWCIELARNLCSSCWPSRRTKCSPLMPSNWWPSVRWILYVVRCGCGCGCGGENFKHLSQAFCTAILRYGEYGVDPIYFRYLLCPFYK